MGISNWLGFVICGGYYSGDVKSQKAKRKKERGEIGNKDEC